MTDCRTEEESKVNIHRMTHRLGRPLQRRSPATNSRIAERHFPTHSHYRAHRVRQTARAGVA